MKPSEIAFAGVALAICASNPMPAHAGEWQTTVVPAAAPVSGHGLTGKGHRLAGLASYYWQGQMTAMGERFDKRALTAAHQTLPFGTKVRVTRLDTGSSVVVRINDRGPFTKGRVIDLSERAAEELRMKGRGTAPVKIEVLGK